MVPVGRAFVSAVETSTDVAAEIEALFREARQRRHRRWIGGALVATSVLAVVVSLLAVGSIGGGGGVQNQSRSGPPPAASVSPPAQTVPAGDGAVGAGPTAIDFSDPSHGWIANGNLGLATRNPTIVRTTDGGQSWERTSVPNLAAQSIEWQTDRDFGALVGIHFSTPARGWFFQAGIGWQTNDAGKRWTLLHFPVDGALVALTSSGEDVWALVDTCPIGAVSCPQNMAKGTLYHATSAQTLRWRRVGGSILAGIGVLYPGAGHSVLVALGSFTYHRSVGSGSAGSSSNDCESIGPLNGGELAGVCGGGGGGNASVSTIAVSNDHGDTWRHLVDGPPSTEFIGTLTTNGADAVFYVTGGQNLWRTGTSEPGWQPVLEASAGSTDEIYPVYVTGAHGYALVSDGLDVHWFETTDGGVSWESVVLP